MEAIHTTRPHVVKTAAAVVAERALATAHRANGIPQDMVQFGLLNDLSVHRATLSMASGLFLPEAKSEALYDQADKLWDRIAEADITSRFDAAAKLELVLIDDDEGREPTAKSMAMIRQVERWLRDPFVWTGGQH